MKTVICEKLYDTDTAKILYEEFYPKPRLSEWENPILILILPSLFLSAIFFIDAWLTSVLCIANSVLLFFLLYNTFWGVANKKLRRLYKTQKGNYFYYHLYWPDWKYGKEQEIMYPTDEDSVKRWLAANHPDIYVKHFGQIKEA